MNYLPLWKIGVTKREKVGRFKKKTVMVKSFYYVNGMTGGILHFDKDEKSLEFPFRIKEPDEIVSFKGIDIDTRAISLKLLKDDLMQRPYIWRCAEKFPSEPIVQYSWPGNTMIKLWDRAEEILERSVWQGVTL